MVQRKIWWVLLFALLWSSPPVSAQVDTSRVLSYFPLHEGNRWQYDVELYDPSYDTTWYSTVTHTVRGDTIMPNGQRYSMLHWDYYDRYVRIDTSALVVLEYQPGETCVDSERVVYPLIAQVGTTDTMTQCTYMFLSWEAVWDTVSVLPDSVRVIGIWERGGLNPWVRLAPNIGAVGWGWDELGTKRATLLGAEVNGHHYGTIQSVDPPEFPLPEHHQLFPAYPNPFNPQTRLTFRMGVAGTARLQFYNIRGRRVSEIVRSIATPGSYEYVWDGTTERGLHVSSGVYFVRFLVNGKPVGTRKLIKLE